MLPMSPHYRLTAAVGALAAVALAGCGGTATIPGLDEPATGAPGSAAPSSGSAAESAPSTTSPAGGGPAAAPTTTPITVTLGAVGEVAADPAVIEATRAPAGQFDFTPLLAAIRPYARGADIALCHLESPISATGAGAAPTLPYPPAGAGPRELLHALTWAGFTGCASASEHTMDAGLDGLRGTISAFRGAGLGYAGPGTGASGPVRVAVHQAGAATVAHLAYTYSVLPYDPRPNTQTPPDAPWLARSLWREVTAAGIIADAEDAKDAGADFVAVSMHWGEPFATNPTQDEVDLADALLRSPSVDVVFGAHGHLVQPCRRINRKYAFLGLGDLLTGQSRSADGAPNPAVQDGVFVQVTLRRGADGTTDSTASYLPTRVDPRTFVVSAAAAEDDRGSFTRVTRALKLLDDCPLSSLS